MTSAAEPAATADELSERLRAYTSVRGAVGRLAQLGPVSEVIDRCAAEAAGAVELDRVLLSRITDGVLLPERLHLRAGIGHDGPTLEHLRAAAVPLDYPLLECELLRRRHAQIVADVDPGQPGRYAFAATMRWREYLAAAVFVEGRAIAFLHGDREPDAPKLTRADAETLEDFAAGFALVFERAVLRRRLRDQRREIQHIATWAEVRGAELSDGVIDLSAGQGVEPDDHQRAPDAFVDDDGALAHLTSREVDVLKLMAAGKTNASIARTLVVSEGTVKFHVKNVLRKMQASNRSDATSRYLRSTLRKRPARG